MKKGWGLVCWSITHQTADLNRFFFLPKLTWMMCLPASFKHQNSTFSHTLAGLFYAHLVPWNMSSFWVIRRFPLLLSVFLSLSLSLRPDEKEKAKISLEELQIKKVKKKKKKKHKEGEKHKRVKMYHRSCQTICAGLLLLPPSSPPSNPLHNSSLSPFKSPLPVYPPPNNKTAHLMPSSPTIASKPLFNTSIHNSIQQSPSIKHQHCSYPGMAGLEFAPYIHIENQPNGGALVAHAYASQLSSLSAGQKQRFAQEFVTLAFREDSSQVQHRFWTDSIIASFEF